MKKILTLAIAITLYATAQGQRNRTSNEIRLPADQNSFMLAPSSDGSDLHFLLPVARVNQFWRSSVGSPRNVLSNSTTWIAEIIWQDFDLDGTGQVLTLTPGKETGTGPNGHIGLTLKNYPNDQWGNVVVGIKKEGEETYLWSWHIWITDFTLDRAVTYPTGLIGMDRFLGAKSAVPGNAGTLGLMYQWHRKDPFPGAADITSNEPATTAPNDIWKTQDPVEGGTYAFAAQNPTTFVTGITSNHSSIIVWEVNERNLNNRGDWLIRANPTNSRTRGIKSIQDPCPKGWKVPHPIDELGETISPWNGFVFGRTFVYDSENKGFMYAGRDWWPMAGRLNYITGALQNVGTHLFSSTTQSSTRTFNEELNNTVRSIFGTQTAVQVYETTNNRRAAGTPIRCMRFPADDR